MSDNQNLNSLFAMMVATLRTISNYSDCNYDLDYRNKELPCGCPPCTAKQALQAMSDWRFTGARHERVHFNPREAKVMHAWSKAMNDRKLSQILDEEGIQPTPRDWYVATSVVQWLPTNCGTEILEAAGYKYQDGDTDYKWQQERLKASMEHQSFTKCGMCHAPDREKCGHWVGKL